LEALMATKREEAQKRRAEDRRKRRGEAPGASAEAKQDDSSSDEPLDTVKHAAKVAAAAAAVGAAMGAARAMTGNGDHDEAPEPASEQEEPRGEHEEPRDEPEPSAEQDGPREPRAEGEREPDDAEEPEHDRRPSGAAPSEARRVVAAAREQLAALLGKQADAVSGLERTDRGWIVTLDVVELARIPESTDVLASYDLELDEDRNLVRYSRGRRFYRSEADDGALS
jgi:Gas vesicle synthesis protein GvpO